MRIDLSDAVRFLRQHDRYLILSHNHPDGDTVGSAAALCHALRAIGKRARTGCSDLIPPLFSYITDELADDDFEPETLIAVDAAAAYMLGPELAPRAGEVALCIDHHPSNEMYARQVLLEDDSAATAEIIYELVEGLGVPLNRPLAEALYTGFATDTGCFRYANTTPRTHLFAAETMRAGARADMINSINFVLKSRVRVRLEQELLSTLTYYYGGRVSVMHLTQAMLRDAGASPSDADALSYLTRQVIGVDVGLLFKETPEGGQKVSVRSNEACDSSQLCQRFGGGGHRFASGCSFDTDFVSARDAMLRVIGGMLDGKKKSED